MAQKFISVKNFQEYQHYTKRNPPWIKLHLSILDDPDFLRMPDESKWHYIGLILLASRHGNAIKPDWNYIKNRLGLTEKVDITQRFLKDHLLASNASKTLLTNSSVGGSETETETETETEVGTIRVLVKRSPPPSDEDWLESLRKAEVYRGVEVDRELGKCRMWCETNRKPFSRRRFVNWLNRVERPMRSVGITDPSGMREQAEAFLRRGVM